MFKELNDYRKEIGTFKFIVEGAFFAGFIVGMFVLSAFLEGWV